MIVFVDGPHGEKLSKKEQKEIEKHLISGSFAWRLNMAYNNMLHFSSHSSYDIHTFLKDLQYIRDSKQHTLQIMGGEHTDSYGHTSGMIGQYTPYGEYVPAVVKDTYIRFKIIQDTKHFKMLKSLDTFSVYHFLVSAPYIEKLHLHSSVPVVMYPIEKDLLPISRYSRSQILFQQ